MTLVSQKVRKQNLNINISDYFFVAVKFMWYLMPSSIRKSHHASILIDLSTAEMLPKVKFNELFFKFFPWIIHLNIYSSPI